MTNRIKKTYKFRLYPTIEQEKQLLWTLEQCRFVYNFMLNWYKKTENVNKYAWQNSLPKLKEEYPELKNVYSKALQYEVHRLFSNLKTLSQLKKKSRKIGKLRFKNKGSFKTIHYNQSGFKIISSNSRLNKLHISKIGNIPIRIHRHIKGEIKQVVIKKYSSDKWFACIIIEMENMSVKQPIKNVVGIDLGIKHFLSDGNGKQIKNPHYLKKTLYYLRRRQKRLSKTKKYSKNRAKQHIKIAQLHEKITNQRNDFLHKLSRCYINNYDLVAIEDLNIKGMIRNHYLSQYISDVAWHRFIQMLSYKAESAGKTVVKVNPRGTSKIHKYGKLDRDYNASLNILERGLKKVGMGQTEFTPVDTEALQKLYIVSANSVVESGSIE
ncbi:MAG: transposase [Thermoplasmatales archaeon]|nr:transposase [Thermoplasmatales archaeon]